MYESGTYLFLLVNMDPKVNLRPLQQKNKLIPAFHCIKII